ncbi:MAG: hypothetical protein ACW7DY_22285 [Paraglaciecola chathamensis]
MKITLDHNCLINLANNTAVGRQVRKIVDSPETECFVVNIGASEMRERGVLPNHYDLFEKFLTGIGLYDLKRINPLAIIDVTYWDHSVRASDGSIELLNDIELILFPNILDGNIADEGIDSKFGRKWLNRICDIHSMWCHINNGNDIFLTADKNFMKKTKLPHLIELGANSIMHPNDVNV